MKRQILLSLILVGSNLTTNAQNLYLPNGINGIKNNTTNSNIGIGVATPDAPFTVYGVSHIYPNMSPISDVRLFSIKYSMSNPNFVSNNFPVVIGTGGGDQPLILDAARIGIGSLNPDKKLTINGDFKVVNGNNEFSYNGLADIIFRFNDRGTGGRAIVHDVNNRLVLNYNSDFTGGTRIGSNLSVTGMLEVDKTRSTYGGFRLIDDNIDDYNVLFQMGRGGTNGGFRFYSNCKPWDNGGEWGTGTQKH